MLFSFFGDSLRVVNPSYYFLVEFIIGLSFFIITWVLVVMVYQVILHKGVGLSESENNPVEFIWTFIPSVAVLFFSFFNVSCFNLDLSSLGHTMVKVVGHQWYWSYGLPELNGLLYDSVMSDFIDGVDKPLRLTSGVSYCFYVTSADVLHSFSVPFLSIKIDAIPGLVNQFPFIADYSGRHMGYCTELCGAGHVYMPIVVEIISPGYVSGF